MKIKAGNISEEPRIELIPLIDVIFCILTFFLLAGLQAARQQAISVDIPNAATGTPAARELLMVSLNDAGQIFLEQQPLLAPAQLVEAVKLYRQARPNSSIVLYASKQVSYSKVVEILDVLRNVAGDRVALATLPTNTVAPTPPILTNPGFGYPGGSYLPYPGVNPGNYSPGPGVIPNSPQPGSSGIEPNPSQLNQPTQINPDPVNQPIPSTTSEPTPIPSQSPKS